MFGAQFPLFDAGVPFLVEAFDLTVEFVFLETDPDLSLFSEEIMELVDLSLSWGSVINIYKNTDKISVEKNLS